jgi:hypothetical protein
MHKNMTAPAFTISAICNLQSAICIPGNPCKVATCQNRTLDDRIEIDTESREPFLSGDRGLEIDVFSSTSHWLFKLGPTSNGPGYRHRWSF